jgi:hypothetical protein
MARFDGREDTLVATLDGERLRAGRDDEIADDGFVDSGNAHFALDLTRQRLIHRTPRFAFVRNARGAAIPVPPVARPCRVRACA